MLRKSGGQPTGSHGHRVDIHLHPSRRAEEETTHDFRALAGVLVDIDQILAINRAASTHHVVYAWEALATNDADAPSSLVAFDVNFRPTGDDLKFLISAV
ncbi:MAG: hypothetical protein HY735_06570 [Verrucomicrobia bacterium]|nr:hypothetical protein [Verrucomicrobiota bacterium]